VNVRGEEAGAQNLDSMDKNNVERHKMPGKLARDSKALKESKQSYVYIARFRGKRSYLIWGGLSSREYRSQPRS